MLAREHSFAGLVGSYYVVHVGTYIHVRSVGIYMYLSSSEVLLERVPVTPKKSRFWVWQAAISMGRVDIHEKVINF